MKNIYKPLLLTTLFFVSYSVSYGRENIGMPGQRVAGSYRVEANDCKAATSQIDLNVNNVRARLMNGGDMWWDLRADARYEVPKIPVGSNMIPVSSLFAGAIWVGGIDLGGQLKIAAQTYRQSGNDYFPGPLDENGETTADICNQWDEQWQVYSTDIETRDANAAATGVDFSKGEELNESLIPSNLMNWPAKNNPYNALPGNRNMAPFADVDGDGIYNPAKGDYPEIGTIKKQLSDGTWNEGNSHTVADQMIWWVYNDKGNIHTETGGQAIGLEIHTLAFAFKTNDEINDMTFYKYTIYNKATSVLDSAYMGQWCDPDLGCAFDDYVGCDSARSLGIVYNAQAVDGGSGCAANYGNQPPIIGIDYFKGPIKYDKDTGDSTELSVTSFLYYNNDFTVMGNPENAAHYYGYLSGSWKDGTHFTKGGTGYGGSVKTNFVFPDSPDQPKPAWSECAENNPITQDKRIIQASGPFRLLPGATNEIIIGVVWVRPPVGTYPCPNFGLLQKADDKAQALFNSNFKILDGPNAPDMKITELDKKATFAFVNTNNSKVEGYSDYDPVLLAQGVDDPYYRFQGYQVFQLATPTVSIQELYDPSKARQVMQCDIKDEAIKLINYEYDPNIEADVPTVKVNATNTGIKHTFELVNDEFAAGDKRMVNFKKYYFLVISYAYNGSVDTMINKNTGLTTYIKKRPYLAGRKNIRVYTVIPHKPAPENSGLVLNSDYGSGPMITRQEGKGNDGNWLDLTQQSVNDILKNVYSFHPVYEKGNGPAKIKVFDPKSVPSGEFELVIRDTTPNGISNEKAMPGSSMWYLKNETTSDTIFSENTILVGNEQVIPDWGLSVYINQVRNPGSNSSEDKNGLIGSSITYADPLNRWLSGVADQEGESYFNWIRCGTVVSTDASKKLFPDITGSGPGYDNGEFYENLIDRTWGPYRMCGSGDPKYIYTMYSPAWYDQAAQGTFNKLDSLISVDIVFTPDKSKWTRCPVVESGTDKVLTEGNVAKCALRQHPSLYLNSNGGYYYSGDPNDVGYSYFPGYAIEPETGRRLNMMFAENSRDIENNGNDLIWNPTSNYFSPQGGDVGGRHFIYVMRSTYNEGADFKTLLKPVGSSGEIDQNSGRNVYKLATWTSIPMLTNGYKLKSFSEGLIPTETTIKIRVNKPYQKYVTDVNMNNSFPRYIFSTSDIAAVKEDITTAKNALDTIGIVPNPYYAYSPYETNQLDSRIKFINLPKKCTISIFSLDGTLVRKITRDDDTNTYTDWDLKNNVGVPIASGVYLIHINAEGIGEKVLKWFGVMRPVDLSSF